MRYACVLQTRLSTHIDSQLDVYSSKVLNQVIPHGKFQKRQRVSVDLLKHFDHRSLLCKSFLFSESWSFVSQL